MEYQLKSELLPLSSTVVWSRVSENIISNKMEEADTEKHVVEQEQRKRIQLGREPQFFEYNENFGLWTYKRHSFKSVSPHLVE